MESPHSQDILESTSTPAEAAFLAAALKKSVQPVHDENSLLYIRYIRTQFAMYPNKAFEECFTAPTLSPASGTGDPLFALMEMIAQLLSDDIQATVNHIVSAATSAGIFKDACGLPGDSQRIAQHCVMSASGWILMLYPALAVCQIHPHLRQDNPSQLYSPIADIIDCSRPLVEALPSLIASSNALPMKESPSGIETNGPAPSDSLADALHVSYLNANVMQTVAGITIEWTDCIGSHLSLDVTNRRLYVFCLPSYCHVNTRRISILSR